MGRTKGGYDMDDLGNKKIFSRNLRAIMERFGKERTQLCADLDIKYTTFADWYNGNKYPRIDKIEQLAAYFGVKKSDLIEDKGGVLSIDAPESRNYTNRETAVISKYRTLDEYGKRAVDVILDVERERITESAPAKTRRTKVIPLFGNSFAAGAPEPNFDNLWSDYEVDANSKADFAIHINGQSMQPYLMDGSIALGVKRAPQIGEVVALQIDGENVCKQYCEDNYGNLYLFSLNREYKDIVVMQSGNQSVKVIGTILIDGKLPPIPKEVNTK